MDRLHPSRQPEGPVKPIVKAASAELASPFFAEEAARRIFEALGQGQGIAIACSGGPDSTALAALMHGLYPEHRERVHLLHFNHKTRGEDSDKDAAFVEALAEEFGFRCGCGGLDEAPEDSSEAALRELRHAFFRNYMGEKRISLLLLGHTQDDVAETMLMRLARGSDLEGLCAPSLIQEHGEFVYLRPLLKQRKEAILAFLKAADLGFREDFSNASAQYFRNRVRQEVLPALKAATHHDVLKNFERSHGLLNEAAEALEFYAGQVFSENELGQIELGLGKLKGLPVAVARRVLHRWLTAHTIRSERAAFDQILDAVQTRQARSISLGQQICVVIQADTARITHQKPVAHNAGFTPVYLESLPAHTIELPKGTLQFALNNELAVSKTDNNTAALLDFDKIHFPLTIRPRRSGDCYQKLGASGSKKLKEHWIDAKVPQELRGSLPVVEDANGMIIWAAHLPPCHEVRITDATKRALLLTYQAY